MHTLDGPRVEPSSGQADALVVLLHGYGADGSDLIALAQEWKSRLPRAAFVAPHAPEPLAAAGPAGRQWFPLSVMDPAELWVGVSTAGPALDALLEAELRRRRLPPERLALVGFSQGTMLALHVGLRRSPAPAGIVGYSGIIAGPENMPEAVGGRPPILLIHGDQDEVIPVEALDLTREVLAARGYPVEWHRRPGIPHGIDPIGLKWAGHFLAQALG
jgi:phospholipase/carboxylesterase